MNQRRVFIAIIGILIVIILIFLIFFILSATTPVSNEWAIKTTQIDQLHDLGYYGSGVTIGIIDTGVDYFHPEFDQSSFIAWTDFITQKGTYYDDGDHGTHIAGILVSKGSYGGILAGINLQGIAPEAKLIIAKTIPKNQYIHSTINDSSIAQSIQFCIDNNADIILLSLGKNPDNINLDENSMTAEVCNQAIEQGIFIIAPAGNDGYNDDGDVAFPGILENVISVGSIGKEQTISSFSSQGHQYPDTNDPNKKPEIIAPGDKIVSSRINGSYGEIGGTSQAAAYVTGGLALILEAYPEYKHDGIYCQNETTIQQFKEIFMITALKVGSLERIDAPFSHDDRYGYGIIQFYNAYEQIALYL